MCKLHIPSLTDRLCAHCGMLGSIECHNCWRPRLLAHRQWQLRHFRMPPCVYPGGHIPAHLLCRPTFQELVQILTETEGEFRRECHRCSAAEVAYAAPALLGICVLLRLMSHVFLYPQERR